MNTASPGREFGTLPFQAGVDGRSVNSIIFGKEPVVRAQHGHGVQQDAARDDARAERGQTEVLRHAVACCFLEAKAAKEDPVNARLDRSAVSNVSHGSSPGWRPRVCRR